MSHQDQRNVDRRVLSDVSNYICPQGSFDQQCVSNQLKSASRKRYAWNEEEDGKLKKLVEYYGFDWPSVSKHIPGRTPKQCKNRWTRFLDPTLVRGFWTKEEDKEINEFVKKNGPRGWNKISCMLVGRTGKQCRERWHNHLDPNVNKGPWTNDEEETIIKQQFLIGNRWAEISRKMIGRTDNAVKNHWNSTLRKQVGRIRELTEGLYSKRSVSCFPSNESTTDSLETFDTRSKDSNCDQPQFFILQNPGSSSSEICGSNQQSETQDLTNGLALYNLNSRESMDLFQMQIKTEQSQEILTKNSSSDTSVLMPFQPPLLYSLNGSNMNVKKNEFQQNFRRNFCDLYGYNVVNIEQNSSKYIDQNVREKDENYEIVSNIESTSSNNQELINLQNYHVRNLTNIPLTSNHGPQNIQKIMYDQNHQIAQHNYCVIGHHNQFSPSNFFVHPSNLLPHCFVPCLSDSGISNCNQSILVSNSETSFVVFDDTSNSYDVSNPFGINNISYQN